MSDTMVDLGAVIDQNETALVGRENGRSARRRLIEKKVVFDQLENQFDHIIINIPERIISMNRSFFLGAFADRVKALGKEDFTAKYVFNTSEHIKNRIDDLVDSALKDASPSQILNV